MPLPGTKFKRTKAVALDSPVSLLFGDMPLGAEKTFELGQGPNDALEYLFNFPVADEITYGSEEYVGLNYDILHLVFLVLSDGYQRTFYMMILSMLLIWCHIKNQQKSY